jgi:hypothetical protein
MKVTKWGDARQGYEGEWTCMHCGCKWIMEKSDPKPQFYSDQRDGTGYHMPCPTCKKEIYRDVPANGQYQR